MFVVGELPVGDSEPSLLEVFLTKTFSALSPFLYLPVRKESHENEVQKPLECEIKTLWSPETSLQSVNNPFCPRRSSLTTL